MGTVDKFAGMYPAPLATVWSVKSWIQDFDMEPKTTKQIATFFNLPDYKVRRMLEPLVKKGYLNKRSESFWNGMFYAVRFWYW